MKIKQLHLIVALVSVWQLSVTTAHAQITKLPDGIVVSAGGSQIGLLAVNDAAFCISVNSQGTPSRINSVFIENTNAGATAYKVISEAPVYGIKTSYGKLLVNTNSKVWSLYAPDGKVLISDGTYTTDGTATQITHTAEGRLYGSGNIASKELVKDKSATAVGNGLAGIPYFWNTAGYSAFAVSANDDDPATWSRPAGDKALVWKYNGKAANLYLWPAKTMYDAAQGYIKLTGKPKLPPRWAFGYLQSQWGWADSTYIADVADKFRGRKLPVDAFIYDFEWYTTTPDYAVKKEGQEGFVDFDFNPLLFPHPAKQIDGMKSRGIKFIGIRKPRIGNNLLLNEMRANGWMSNPGSDSRDLNFSNAGLQKWYQEKNRPLLAAGADAWWNDEGESYYTCYYWWNKTQYDLLASARPNYRHFTLNRAFGPGDQRFGYCTWSGDIHATWESLAEVPKDLLNFSLAGMYYGSCDIGGFHGTPTKEMLVRWFEAGAFLPIMRAHSDIGTKAHFPFLWEEDGEAAIRKALNLRYQLLPYIYSLGHEAYTTGAPIMRPLVMEFPTDAAVANTTDEWLVGKGLLVAPVLNEGGKRDIYFPAGNWYDYYTGSTISGPKTISVQKALDEIPVYVRAGTILPVGPVVQYSDEASGAPLEIRIYPGKDGSFKMVEDDGESYNYTKGSTKTTEFNWNEKTKTLKWKVSGRYSGTNTYKKIKVVLGNQSKDAVIGKKGKLVF